jgi:hypothetical protein
MRKLASTLSTIRTNFVIGTAKDSTDSKTNRRSETSYIPIRERGLEASPSSHGYCAIVAQPAAKVAMTPSGSFSSDPDKSKRPDRTPRGEMILGTWYFLNYLL